MASAEEDMPGPVPLDPSGVQTLDDLADVLRRLRRRHARRHNESELTFRELAARTGYAYGIIAEYFGGKALAPTDRFDALVRLLGATAAEQGALATARDRVEERRRGRGATLPGPRELPPDVFGFTGRGEQLAELDRLLKECGQGPAAAVISAVSGTAGVGKTALAVRWAHRVGHRFPDGCLYLDLRGYDPDRPLHPVEALAALLRSLGVTGADLPQGEADRAARFRTLLAGRRMLIVLDNASGSEQVRPLLPGEAGCFVLVTSRDALTGLVVRHGARRVGLDLLPPAEAVRLLRRLVGPRADAEPEAATALVERCARLPLAVRIAAELAAVRPAAALAELVEELTGARRRLDLLDAGGDPRTATRAVFSWSYQHLAADAARAFRLIGLHPGHRIDAYGLAAMAAVPLDRAGQLLDGLARAHLVQPAGPGRYGMHDLLRAYAAELARSEEPAGAREEAVTRLLDLELYTAAAAMDARYPTERHRRPRVDPPDTALRPVDEPAAAQDWLDSERADLAALVRHAARHGWPGHATRLSKTLARYLHTGHFDVALAVHGDALCAAREHDDVDAEGAALHNLAATFIRLGRFQEALDHLVPALATRRQVGDRSGEGAALTNLGIVCAELGRPAEAAEHLEQALAISREIGARATEGYTLSNLGRLYIDRGRHAEALPYLTEAAAVLGEIGEAAEGAALNNLASLHLDLGRHAEARRWLERALEVHRSRGPRAGEAETLQGFGALYRATGRPQEAIDHYQQALAIFRELGTTPREAEVLNDLGETLAAAGRLAVALDHHEAALTVANGNGHRAQRDRALTGIAQSRSAGDRWAASGRRS